MARTITIDEESCMGCEACVEVCPDVFGFNEDEEKAYVIDPNAGTDEDIQEAAETCPSESITVELE